MNVERRIAAAREARERLLAERKSRGEGPVGLSPDGASSDGATRKALEIASTRTRTRPVTQLLPDTPKADVPKPDAPKADVPKVDTPKAAEDAPKSAPPVTAPSTADTAPDETTASDAPRSDLPGIAAPSAPADETPSAAAPTTDQAPDSGTATDAGSTPDSGPAPEQTTPPVAAAPKPATAESPPVAPPPPPASKAHAPVAAESPEARPAQPRADDPRSAPSRPVDIPPQAPQADVARSRPLVGAPRPVGPARPADEKAPAGATKVAAAGTAAGAATAAAARTDDFDFGPTRAPVRRPVSRMRILPPEEVAAPAPRRRVLTVARMTTVIAAGVFVGVVVTQFIGGDDIPADTSSGDDVVASVPTTTPATEAPVTQAPATASPDAITGEDVAAVTPTEPPTTAGTPVATAAVAPQASLMPRARPVGQEPPEAAPARTAEIAAPTAPATGDAATVVPGSDGPGSDGPGATRDAQIAALPATADAPLSGTTTDAPVDANTARAEIAAAALPEPARPLTEIAVPAAAAQAPRGTDLAAATPDAAPGADGPAAPAALAAETAALAPGTTETAAARPALPEPAAPSILSEVLLPPADGAGPTGLPGAASADLPAERVVTTLGAGAADPAPSPDAAAGLPGAGTAAPAQGESWSPVLVEEALAALFEDPEFAASVPNGVAAPSEAALDLDVEAPAPYTAPVDLGAVAPAVSPEPRSRPETAPALDDPATAAPAGIIANAIVHAPSTVPGPIVAGAIDALSASGAAVEAPRRVDFRVTQSNVRYFHQDDAPAARTLATAIGAVARDFTNYQGAPIPTGTVEVWLSGDETVLSDPDDLPADTPVAAAPIPAPAPAPAPVAEAPRTVRQAPATTRQAPARQAPATSARDRELRDLKNRIILRLRRGDHL